MLHRDPTPHLSFLHILVGDAVSLTVIVGAILGALPTIATLLAVAWYIFAIMDSEAYKRWCKRRRRIKAAKRRKELERKKNDIFIGCGE